MASNNRIYFMPLPVLDTQAGDISRPVLRWHGGKWLLAPWIISYFPEHKVYVEPFGGAASVLLRKPRAYAEIYNDLDDEVVCLFRVLRHEGSAKRLVERLELTAFARAEFEAAYAMSPDPVEIARCLIVRSYMGFGSDGTRRDLTTGFRASSSRSGTTPARDWQNYPAALGAIIDRLRGVVVEHRGAIACMARHDSPETLHYVDPPYMPATRQTCHRGHGYNHELTADDHRVLLAELKQLSGMVVLSGYDHPLYETALTGWFRTERATYADGARPRREVLWINPVAYERLESHMPLLRPCRPSSTLS